MSILRAPGVHRRAGRPTLKLLPPAPEIGLAAGGNSAAVNVLVADPPTDTPHGELLGILAKLDIWLGERADRPSASALLTWRDEALTEHPKVAQAVLDSLGGLIAVQTTAAVAALPKAAALEELRRLTRLALLLDLIDSRVLGDAELKKAAKSTNVVFDALRRRTVLLPNGVAPKVPAPRVQLLRGAKVSDLFVVRSEWSCYLKSEIAAITNVLPGETHSRTDTRVDEDESTTTQESQRVEATETTEEDRTQTELSREVSRAQEVHAHAETSVNLSGSYGSVQFGSSFGGSVDASVSESSRTASKTARDITSRAVSRVEQRVRDERTQRTLRRHTQRTHHEVGNDGEEIIRGVYRWLDRVDRMQMYRFPDRLLLEFQIPEPAEYLRSRLFGPPPPPPGGVPQPPIFDVSPSKIDASGYGELGKTFRARNLPPPPDPELSKTVTISLEDDDVVSNRDEKWTAPVLAKAQAVVLPRGYAATSISVSVSAVPHRANWRVEWTDAAPAREKTGIEGFHQITCHVQAGSTLYQSQKGTSPQVVEGFERFAVQMSPRLGSWDRPSTYYGDAFLTGSDTSSFTPPVVDDLHVAMTVGGAKAATVSARITCKRLDSAYQEWQNSVYDVLFDAWSAWDREWRLQQQAAGLGPALRPIDGASPTRNLQTITEELKRQVISWLLDDAGFSGIDAMSHRKTKGAGKPKRGAQRETWDRFDIGRARDSAPTIQFLEQAFEWTNLTYVPYPYYWAREQEWAQLADLQGADPRFVDFLRAGSARVAVPARPGFEVAVLNWLIYLEPFLGEPLPLPDNELYLSIATEIRDLTQAPKDGEPGDCWEVRLPTTLMWLDEPSDAPPSNAKRRLGKEPNAPVDPWCAS